MTVLALALAVIAALVVFTAVETRRIKPTLEDVFVRLVEGSDR